jgi:hypothetical protein
MRHTPGWLDARDGRLRGGEEGWSKVGLSFMVYIESIVP